MLSSISHFVMLPHFRCVVGVRRFPCFGLLFGCDVFIQDFFFSGPFSIFYFCHRRMRHISMSLWFCQVFFLWFPPFFCFVWPLLVICHLPGWINLLIFLCSIPFFSIIFFLFFRLAAAASRNFFHFFRFSPTSGSRKALLNFSLFPDVRPQVGQKRVATVPVTSRVWSASLFRHKWEFWLTCGCRKSGKSEKFEFFQSLVVTLWRAAARKAPSPPRARGGAPLIPGR